MPAPTIKDVAKAAGVSVATVSYVINDGPRTVTDETRERVRAAMNQLGYAPNASARRLRRQHNHVIGVALAGMSGRPGISDLYFLEVMRGISIAADRAGYDLMVFSNPKKLGSTEFYQYLAAQHMVDGLIAAGSTINPEGIALMNAAGTPAVLVGRQRSAADIRRVIYTYEADAFWAVSESGSLYRVGLDGFQNTRYCSCRGKNAHRIEKVGLLDVIEGTQYRHDGKAAGRGPLLGLAEIFVARAEGVEVDAPVQVVQNLVEDDLPRGESLGAEAPHVAVERFGELSPPDDQPEQPLARVIGTGDPVQAVEQYRRPRDVQEAVSPVGIVEGIQEQLQCGEERRQGR